jgi:hypothetical protein
VYDFYLENRYKGSKYTVDYFFKEIMPRRDIYYIIERAELDSGHKKVTGSGRVAKIMTKKNILVLKSMFDHKDNVSQRQASQKLNCTQQNISKTLRTMFRIKPR